MAKENKDNTKKQSGHNEELDKLQRRLDMLDRRLDDIDSMISAVIERVMSQGVNLQLSCPNCGKNVEVSLIGVKKPGI
ncbi:MAG: hypothetical protein PHE15_04425 [Dehalococcoidales bacterium]|nr:hypothetical protein [Dehalococcoidales bacterium]